MNEDRKTMIKDLKEERSAWLFIGSALITFAALTVWWIGTNV